MINKIVIIFVLFAVSFIQPGNNPKEKDGAIFGKVAFLEAKNIKPFRITLMGTKVIVRPDKEGYFYINNLMPGLYDIKIQTEGFIDHSAEKIEVLNGKITCLQPFYLDRLDTGKEKIEWDLLEYQNKIEPIRYGKIEGYIADINGYPVKNALIAYNYNKYPNRKKSEYLWEGKSDSTGYFRINKVVPGNYSGISVHGWMTKAVNIVVSPNRITRIKPAIILEALTSNKIDPTLAGAYNYKNSFKISLPRKSIGSRYLNYTITSPNEAKSCGIDLSQDDPIVSATIKYIGNISVIEKLGVAYCNDDGKSVYAHFPLSKLPMLNQMEEILYIGVSRLFEPDLDKSNSKVRQK